MQKTTLSDQLLMLIEKKNYQSVIARLEEVINKGDENNLETYWNLGLVYLLNEQIEEAQSIWLMGITQDLIDGDRNPAKSLIDFLQQTLSLLRLPEQSNHALAIYQQLIELEPDHLDYHLRFINLSYDLGEFDIGIVEDLGSIILLKKRAKTQLTKDELMAITFKILSLPTALSLDFLAGIIPYWQDKEKREWLAMISQFCNVMAYEKKLFRYAIDITKLCLIDNPGNLILLNDLLNFYQLANNREQLAETAKQIDQELETCKIDAAYQTYLYSRCASALIGGNTWSEARLIIQKFQHSFDQLTMAQNYHLNDYLYPRFWGMGFSLFYLFDDPQNNRQYLNEAAKIFQANIDNRKQLFQINLPSHPVKSRHQKIRVGYIGHSLRQHSVGWLCRWLLQCHDADQFEVYAYLIGLKEDWLTSTWVAPYVARLDVLPNDVETILKSIHQDNLDILVDLDVLTNNITAQVLARKPVKCQISWLGSDASGLPSIDYFFVDRYVVTSDAQAYYSEKLWTLPHTYIAVGGFEVGEPTISRNSLGIATDTVIYLSVQNKIKCNPKILHTQLQIIKAVPHSILLIKGGGDNDLIKQIADQMLKELGLNGNHIQFLSPDPDELTHRANLAVADVVLDTYPYNGATTTLETLWMGIPLVTLVGQQFAARNSYDFLYQVGVECGIAHNYEEYIDWGIQYGTDPNLRETVRQQLTLSRRTSPLWRPQQFAQDVESAYRQILAT